MREYVRAENEPELPEIGYHNSEAHVWTIAPAFQSYQQLPEAGGLNDQFADEWDDILTWLALYAYCQFEFDEERRLNGGKPDRDPVESWFRNETEVGDLL